MKKIIAFLVVLVFITQNVFADSTDPKLVDTTLLNKKVDEITNGTKSLKNYIDSTKKEVLDSLKVYSAKKECNCIPIYNDNKDVEGFWNWLLILSPFLLLILVVLIVANRLKGFDFKEALTENEPPKKIIKNPEYNSAVIAANATIPNLPILFPSTIEVSNIGLSLSDIRDIIAAKKADVSSAQINLDNATKNTAALNQAVLNAQAEVDTANAVTAQLTQAAISAQTQSDAVNSAATPDAAAIAAAKTAMNDATKAVTDNATQINAAEEKLKKAKADVEENTKTIAAFTESLPKTKADADVEKIIEISDSESTGAVNSANTYRASISRYIAFITSMVIIILVICMSSFFIYHYIRTGCPPDFGALTTMLIMLGLGMTPYITNKISTAATNK